jgi:hypothetical protein
MRVRLRRQRADHHGRDNEKAQTVHGETLGSRSLVAKGRVFRSLSARQDSRLVRVVAAAGLGFLLSVLWFDLMFDVQAWRRPASDVPASIVVYYRRVVVDAFPMNRLVALVMLTTLGALVGELVQDDTPNWVAAVSLVLVAAAVALAALRTVPNARRLSLGGAPELARRILRDHMLCLVAIVTSLVLQLVFA